jgi:uncharacterized protein YlzI (FlbEa/FlbD family)
MIELHRIGHASEAFHLNPSLVVSIEAHPDTTLLLATGARLVVSEPAERVVELIDAWHAQIATLALRSVQAAPSAAREPVSRIPR